MWPREPHQEKAYRTPPAIYLVMYLTARGHNTCFTGARTIVSTSCTGTIRVGTGWTCASWLRERHREKEYRMLPVTCLGTHLKPRVPSTFSIGAATIVSTSCTGTTRVGTGWT